jgi:large subunit ribosomal protein L2
MPLRTYKATSPGRRWMTRPTFEEITTDQPHKPLLEPRSARRAGTTRAASRSAPRWRGEGAHYRRIDFKRDKFGVPARLATIEYDPNRSARIGLLHYRDGEKRYMLLPTASRSATSSCPAPTPRRGWATPSRSRGSRWAPRSTNIELVPARAARSSGPAGTSAQLLAKEGEFATVRLPSGEMRRVPAKCLATVGQVSNLDHENQSLGKAGRARHMGQRPEVRGVAMTPRDHPHGGGEGKSPTGMPPKTPWGKPAMGYRTRRAKTTGRLIVRSRHRKS